MARIKSSESVKRPGKRISYEAKIGSKDLFDALKSVSKKEEVKKRKGKVTVIRHLTSSFEDYWGCRPSQIVLTKKEEVEWRV